MIKNKDDFTHELRVSHMGVQMVLTDVSITLDDARTIFEKLLQEISKAKQASTKAKSK